MTLSEIPGLYQVKHELLSAVKHNRLSHALLFYSKPGSSALLLARAFAQYISCTNQKENDSCGQCLSCKQFNNFNYPDLTWSFPMVQDKKAKQSVSDDLAKEWREFIQSRPYFTIHDWLEHLNAKTKKPIISVDESQSLIRKTNLKAFGKGYKIILLWLPEYLHPSAANKLLKLLEEPEGKTIFMLVSEQPERLLDTITSRCQKVFIQPHNETELCHILQKEGVDQALAEQSAHLADGNVIEAFRIAEDSERYHEYAEVFGQWMRACFKANVKKIFETVELLNGWGREKQKEALQFYLQTVQHAMHGNLLNSAIEHPLFQKVSFNLNNFSGYIHKQNAGKIYKLLDQAINDINRNGNAKLIFSDCSFKMSNYFHIKA